MPYLKHMSYDATGSTQKSICDSARRVGRKMRYPEKREAAFAEGTLARIQAVLTEGENQVGFIREAVERELTRRKG
jgi:hypothetical protein